MDNGDGMNGNGGGFGGFGGVGGMGGLDQSSVAKQMAALSAAGQVRMQTSVQGRQLSGQSSASPTTTATNMAAPQGPPNPQMVAQALMARRRQFYTSLAQTHFQRGQPLPQQFTGTNTPGYDPNNSPWNRLPVSNELGKLRVNGKDLEIYQLFSLVMGQGGGLAKMTENNSWPKLLGFLDLGPEQLQALAQTLTALFAPIEEMMRRQRQQQAHHQQQQQAPQPPPSDSGQPSRSASVAPINDNVHTPQQSSSPTMDREAEAESRKRKLAQEADAKRARQRTAEAEPEQPDTKPTTSSSPPPSATNAAPPAAPADAPSSPRRRRVEYRPLARHLDEYGGRAIDARLEDIRRISVRQVRSMDEWGALDVDTLAMSIRSRLPGEITYALTTMTMLSILRSGSTGFPLHMAGDVFEELVDLLEDVAGFEGVEDVDDVGDELEDLVTHAQLTQTVLDEGNKLFAPLNREEPMRAPGPRPADTILAIVNILRNLAGPTTNAEIFGRHSRALSILLRLCGVQRTPKGGLKPMSSALNLTELASVRRDTLYLLLSIGRELVLAPTLSSAPSPTSLRLARRTFSLLSSFLLDPSAEPPSILFTSGIPRPPPLIEAASDAFCAVAQPDTTRRVLARAVPRKWLDGMFRGLARRLPIADMDFRMMQEEAWLGYVERCGMGLFTLAFIAPPSLRKSWRNDRTLALGRVFGKMVKKLTVGVAPAMKPYWTVCARRAVETLTLLENEDDAFGDPVQSGGEGQVLQFGMGYGDSEDEKGSGGMGSGMLAIMSDEVLWGVLQQKEVMQDDGMFQELVNLVRQEMPGMVAV
ncbi:hypothetical protein PENSPDRAFT_691766 [Peniophora sp. CONT]|nr:hypothetical protein PENSPDRAFT_691766 [Peniophora sp. CONT]